MHAKCRNFAGAEKILYQIILMPKTLICPYKDTDSVLKFHFLQGQIYISVSTHNNIIGMLSVVRPWK